MPSPTFVGAITAPTAVSSSSVAINGPAGTAADDIVTIGIYVENATVTVTGVPTGFVQEPDSPIRTTSGAGVTSLFVYSKRLTATDAGTWTFSLSASAYRRAVGGVWRGGPDTGDRYEATNSAARSTAATTTPAVTVTTLGADRRLVWFGTNYSSGAWTPPTNFTERQDNSGEVTLADRDLAAQGSSGSVVGTCAGSNWSVAWLGAMPGVVNDLAKADTDSDSLTDAGALSAAMDGVDTQTLADAGVLSVPLTDSDAVSTLSDASSVYRYQEVVIGGATAGAAGGDVEVAHHATAAGAGAAAAGADVEVAHHVEAGGAAAVGAGGSAFAGSTQPGGAAAVASGGVMRVGKAGDAAGDFGIPARVRGQRWRLMAQKVLSGQWISRELPISDPEITWTLGGATQITGVFKPEIKALRDMGLEPWGTWIHLEEEGSIRGSALLTATEVGHDGRLPLDAVGPLGYAAKVPFRGMYSGIQVDPADIVRMIWAHIQGFPRGNLGLTVTGSTPRTVGTEARDVDFVTGEGEIVSFVAGPYQLNYWNNTMCGAEIDKLSTETPFDIIERSGWTTPARQSIYHRLELTYPQRGSRRNDLRFAQGENILEVADIIEPDDAYADTVYVQGKGEGVDSVRGEATVWVGERLRLPVVIADKTVDSTSRANAIAMEELAARLAALVEVPEIVINTAHRHAPLGSFDVGDEILPRVRAPYVGQVRAWHRITSIRYRPTTQRAALSLTRRGEFRG